MQSAEKHCTGIDQGNMHHTTQFLGFEHGEVREGGGNVNMSEVSPFDCADVTFTHGRRRECSKPSKADGVIGQLSMANFGDKVITG